MNEYKSHYKAIYQNINFAARLLHYHLHLSAIAGENQENYNVLNSTARFWNDYNYMTIQTIFIELGKIFDDDHQTYNISLMLKNLKENLGFFSKNELRNRKIKAGLEGEILKETIDRAYEFTIDDVNIIKKEIKRARKLWLKLKPLRDKIYAHHQALSEDERNILLSNVSYVELEDLIQILLDVCFILEIAELNGRKPDFGEYTDSRAEHKACSEIDKIFTALVKGFEK